VLITEKDKRKLSFFLSQEGKKEINQIYLNHKVFIEYNSAKNIGKLFGNEKSIEKVQKILKSNFDKLTSQYKIISLKGKNIFSLLINKMAKWKEIYEKFSKKLDILPKFSQKQLRIQGLPEEILLFEKELDQYISASSISTCLKNTETCGICFGEITECYLLEMCRHKFCQVCLSEMFENASQDFSQFPLKCITCQTPISLQDISEIAGPELLKLLYKRSLENYIQQNKQIYKFCPVPECGQVMKLNNAKPNVIKSKPKTLLCDYCKRNFCTACWKTEHPGASCQSEIDEEVMKSLDLKICKKCKLVIQKIEGCNHMHCKPPYGCNGHMCWQCGEFFETSGECYSHMQKKGHYTINI